MERKEVAVALGRDNGEAAEARRDPEAILHRLREEEAAAPTGRGTLKVFFGYAARPTPC